MLAIGYSSLSAAEPLPLSASYWKDPAFLNSFNGSYRIEARIEPVVSTEVRGLLVEVQKLMADGKREEALKKIKDSSLTKKSPALQFNLGNLQFEEGEMDEAQKSFESAIKDYPSFRRAHRNLGLVLHSDLVTPARRVAASASFTPPTRNGQRVKAIMKWPITLRK